jgi:hypothetical protein
MGPVLILGIIFFYCLLFLVRFASIRDVHSLYGNGAAFFGILIGAAVLILDFSWTPLVVWTLCWILLGRLFRNPVRSLCCACAAPLPGLGLLTLRPEDAGLSPWTVYLWLSLLTLPVLLGVMRAVTLTIAAARNARITSAVPG